jgi:parvulin-like peptidyl-prolyl isomerase
MNWLRKHKTTILVILLSGFLISTFVGFGLYIRTGAGMDVVAEINGEEVPYQYYLSLYHRVLNDRRDKGEKLSPETVQQVKREVIQAIVQETVLYQEAKRFGIQISDQELAQALSGVPAFQKEGKFDPQAYGQALHYALKSTPEEFEESQRKQMAIQRLRTFIERGVKISQAEAAGQYQGAIQSLPAKEKAEFLKKYPNPDAFREDLRREKVSQVLNRWFQQLNTNLKVEVHLDKIEKRLGSPS